MITAVHHHATGDHVYSNHFEGIPAGVKSLPEPNAAMPSAYPQIATVLSNDDPDQKGRIQVQFQWQIPEGLKTNWIRVMTPDAGKSDLHPKNRGHVFIPEEGDQVMVGFRYGDPSRPFVMGSMFHGMNGAGGKDGNVMKSIITRSGHELVFDDTDGKESITITDKSNNIIFIDTANSSIRISAPENIDIEAKNINIRARETLNQSAKNMNIDIRENVELKTGLNYNSEIGENYNLHSKNYAEFIEEDKIVDVFNNYERLCCMNKKDVI